MADDPEEKLTVDQAYSTMYHHLSSLRDAVL